MTDHLHKIIVLREEIGYWQPNELASNSFMEGLMFKEMIEHSHVEKAKSMGKIEIADEVDPFSETTKVITIYAYFDDNAKDAWEKFIFLEKLNGNS